MKLKLTLTLLMCIPHIGMAGLSQSKPSAPPPVLVRIKIANEAALREKAMQHKGIDFDMLKQIGIIDELADKEIVESELPQLVDDALAKVWDRMAPQIKRQIGESEFEKQKTQQKASFDAQCAEIKPQLMELLTADTNQD